MEFFKGKRFKVQTTDGAVSRLDGQEALAVTEPDQHGMVILRADDGTHTFICAVFLVDAQQKEG